MTTASAEPLDRLARFAWDWAPALCQAGHGCMDYHRSWSLVRLLELGGALPRGLDFFRREFEPLARAGRRRVLVCGAADTGFPALVVTAFRAHGCDPELVFVDRCETPCQQNRLYAAHAGIRAEIRAQDAGEIDCAPVDAVVAHSFLHLLDQALRQRVVDAWSRVLAPGGVVLVSTNLSPDESDWVRHKDADAIAKRRASLALTARQAGFDAAAAEEVAEVASRFWSTSPGRPPALTADNLAGLFRTAGLRIARMDTTPLGDQAGPLGLSNRETSARVRACMAAVRS
ncbi:MAG: class I SAM-dependent methyltransferase [Burkholderiales bacterium]|nr:class I SAM-dependent methyltransferase [Burkholderiales bacterium]